MQIAQDMAIRESFELVCMTVMYHEFEKKPPAAGGKF